MGFVTEMQGWFNIQELIGVINDIIEFFKNVIISVDVEKSFDKTQLRRAS